MAFPLPNNPYFPITNPASLADVAELRQNLASRFFGRSHSSPEFDLAVASLSQSPELFRRADLLTNPPKPLCHPNNLLDSPGWFQHALASSLQMGLLQLPRYMLKDICLPPLPPQPLGMRPPRVPMGFESLVPELRQKAFINKPVMNRTEIPRSCGMMNDNNCNTNTTSTTTNNNNSNNFHSNAVNSHPVPFRQPVKRCVDKSKPNLKLPGQIDNQETGALVPSIIDGEVIMGFNVWGEKRLCLPHLFRFVLHNVDLQVIDEACSRLQITCTTCSPLQLNLLHTRKILPLAVTSCGLIRKSDAERLTKYIHSHLQHNIQHSAMNKCVSKKLKMKQKSTDNWQFNLNKNELRSIDGSDVGRDVDDNDDDDGGGGGDFNTMNEIEQRDRTTTTTTITVAGDHDDEKNNGYYKLDTNCIPVKHECFGRQIGCVYPDLYLESNSKCIKCLDCSQLFAPEQFVGHTHTVTEVNNLNHWGFDSTNWRCYLRLYSGRHVQLNRPPDDGTDESSLMNDNYRRLEEFKVKFAQPIKLPLSLSAALRSVGLCASVAPIPQSSTSTVSTTTTTSTAAAITSVSATVNQKQQQRHSIAGIDVSSTAPNKQTVNMQKQSGCILLHNANLTSKHTDQIFNPQSAGVSTNSGSGNILLPQLTLRRLWAPNDGRIKLPPPPKLLTNCDMKSLPENLNTGPPKLLHSHRVIGYQEADQYDRDFIPNVCLKPYGQFNEKKSSYTNKVCTQHNHLSRRYQKYKHLHRCRELYAFSGPNQDSRSRSCSENSSGSRSSRTRSSSASSANSGLCSSVNKPTSIPVNDNLHKRTLNNFIQRGSSREEDYKSKLITQGRISRSNQPLSRSKSLNNLHQLVKTSVKRQRQTSTSCPPQINSYKNVEHHVRYKHSKSLSDRTNCSLKSDCKNLTQSPLSQTTKLCDSLLRQRSRAMAAARAAQGAASRVSPGLWARHFTNFQASSNRSIKLPSARQQSNMSKLGQGHSSAIYSSTTTTATEVMATYSPHSISSNLMADQNAQHVYSTPVVVTNPMKNSLPAAVLALEAIWADLVRHINDYTTAVESKSGVEAARQRLFEQFISMQTCYATHIAKIMDENQKLNEKISHLQYQLLLRESQCCNQSTRTINNNDNGQNSSPTSPPQTTITTTTTLHRQDSMPNLSPICLKAVQTPTSKGTKQMTPDLEKEYLFEMANSRLQEQQQEQRQQLHQLNSNQQRNQSHQSKSINNPYTFLPKLHRQSNTEQLQCDEIGTKIEHSSLLPSPPPTSSSPLLATAPINQTNSSSLIMTNVKYFPTKFKHKTGRYLTKTFEYLPAHITPDHNSQQSTTPVSISPIQNTSTTNFNFPPANKSHLSASVENDDNSTELVDVDGDTDENGTVDDARNYTTTTATTTTDLNISPPNLTACQNSFDPVSQNTSSLSSSSSASSSSSSSSCSSASSTSSTPTASETDGITGTDGLVIQHKPSHTKNVNKNNNNNNTDNNDNNSGDNKPSPNTNRSDPDCIVRLHSFGENKQTIESHYPMCSTIQTTNKSSPVNITTSHSKSYTEDIIPSCIVQPNTVRGNNNNSAESFYTHQPKKRRTMNNPVCLKQEPEN